MKEYQDLIKSFGNKVQANKYLHEIGIPREVHKAIQETFSVDGDVMEKGEKMTSTITF